MSRPLDQRRAKGNGPRHALADKDDASARKQGAERAQLLAKMRRKVHGASDWVPGTVGDDVMTAHKVRDGTPLCGAVGAVDEAQRRVTCAECLDLQ
ncbi:hypothetical protein ITI46_22530 [Streptomyces oryzae]|uniref:DUF4193 domain-containing protein n=1 Tax=Streptomyces oryzae TaxID=1434886 RepID=A0ABS3XG95_9ACTN|nr:hypothetical protein [Streptomyces oryzae]MBO8194418.1 hypothetical protein [Streptomyces oryzae]